MTEDWKEVGIPIRKLELEESVIGWFRAIRQGKFGSLFDFEGERGERFTLPSDTVLTTKLTQDLVGKKLKITYLEDLPSTTRRGKSYKNYKVEVSGSF